MKRFLYLLIIAVLSTCTYNSKEELFSGIDDCDTTDVSFSQDVNPIIDNNCVQCHGSDEPPWGISLTGYNEIKETAETGQLLGTIKHEEGYSPMPPNSPKLEDCKIATIEAWINDGMPDN